MSNQWYYSQDDKRHGPVSEAEIIRLIQNHELAPIHPVAEGVNSASKPANEYACFYMEVHPKKKASKQADTSTTSKSNYGGASQPERHTTAQPPVLSSPAVVTAPVQKSGLPWVVAGSAVVMLVGVVVWALFFVNHASDTPLPTRVVSVTTNTPPSPPPSTNNPPITLPPMPNPKLAQSHYERAQNFYYGSGGESQDYAEALKWHHKAANMGHANGQATLGRMYQAGLGVGRNYSEALKWHRKAALQGNANAQFNLGLMYANGKGVPKDDKEAVKWYRKAALEGNANAQFNLGVSYYNSKGVPKDNKEAVKWYYEAALQGNADAQGNLGMMCLNGHGVIADYREAVEWFLKAALQGNANAQFNLGVSYENGKGVEQDFKEAVKWYREAALGGDVNAQFNLGLMYVDGKGVPRNYVTAYAWQNIAAANGDAQAAKDKAVTAKRLTSGQITQAQALSRTLSNQIRTP